MITTVSDTLFKVFAVFTVVCFIFAVHAHVGENQGIVKQAVSFKSEEVMLKGVLYVPEASQSGVKLPAVMIGGSWTTVKEHQFSSNARA